jgi:hypothetical protein
MTDPTQPHHHDAGDDLELDGDLGVSERAAVVRP